MNNDRTFVPPITPEYQHKSDHVPTGEHSVFDPRERHYELQRMHREMDAGRAWHFEL